MAIWSTLRSSGMFRSTLAASALATLLGLSILGDIETRDARGMRSLQALEAVANADRTLQHDVLLVRSDLLRNYDPLAADERAVKASLAALRRAVHSDRLDARPLRALDMAFKDEMGEVETFKTWHALVRNSLAYLPLLVGQALADEQHDPLLSSRAQALATVVMRLVSDQTPEALSDLVAAIADVSTVDVPRDDLATRSALKRQAELLARLVPARDKVLRAIAAAPLRGPIDAMSDEIRQRAAAMADRARLLTGALYVVSVLLVLLTARMSFNQRRSRLELLERAAIERNTASISTLIVAAQPEEIDGVLDEVVACIGRESRLDRVTLIRSGRPHIHRWTRTPGEPAPADLGRLLMDVVGEAEDAAAISGRSETIAGLVRISVLPRAPGRAARRLAATGARSWAGFVVRRHDLALGILSFEATSLRARWPHGGPAAFRPLAHVIEEALERERIIAERQALQDRLAQAQRLEAAGALASGIAHNFNNIVGAVLGHAELAADNIGRGTSPRVHIDEIRRAAHRASELVDNMLNLGRRNPASGTVDLPKLVAETVSLVRPSLPRGVAVQVEMPTEAAIVVGRSGELQQVVLNLVRNATQACGLSGAIGVRLIRTDIDDPRDVQVGSLRRGDYLRLTVSDDGDGMDAATLDRIFEPFFTTRPAGTGLGLATVADIVRDHGGAMQVLSAEDLGSVFHVWLPRAMSVTDAVSGRGDGQIILLLVEDDRDGLYKLEDTVAALGYEPAGCISVEEAAQSLRDDAAIDAILVDATGAHRDSGAHAVTSLFGIRPHLPILVLGDPEDLQLLRKGARPGVHVFDRYTGATGLARTLGTVLEASARAAPFG